MKKLLSFVLLLLIGVIFSCISCSRLHEFTASNCLPNKCKLGLTDMHYDADGFLVIEYTIRDICDMQYWGDIEFRNDSLILIAKTNVSGAFCDCGYVLKYAVKGVSDTLDLKIGFEKEYADFVNRILKKGEKRLKKEVRSEKQEVRLERKRIKYLSKVKYKSHKKRKAYRKMYSEE
jgi:hypothetical protein